VRQVPGIERVVNELTVVQPGAEGFEPPDA
jgi:hypothetical protein